MQQRILTKALKAAWNGASTEHAKNLPVHAILEELGLLQGIGGPNSLRASFESLDNPDEPDEIGTQVNHVHGEACLEESVHHENSLGGVEENTSMRSHDQGMETLSGIMKETTSYNEAIAWRGHDERFKDRQSSSVSTEPPPLLWKDSPSTIASSLSSPIEPCRPQSSNSTTLNSPPNSTDSLPTATKLDASDPAPTPRRRSSQKPTFCPLPPRPIFPPHLQLAPSHQEHCMIPSTSVGPNCIAMSDQLQSYPRHEMSHTTKQEASAVDWTQQMDDADAMMAAWPPNAMDLDLDLDMQDSEFERRTFSDWLGQLE